MSCEEAKQLEELLSRINREHKLDRMKAFIQHGNVTTYDHCISVAKMSLRINRRLKAGADEEEMVRGALLHDYFLYDWHHWDGVKRGALHGLFHPGTALKNAKRDFALTRREENIIYSHMWPLTPFQIPRYREAVIVCLADKMVSARETLTQRKKRRMRKKEKGIGETGTTD